jgi:parvulin-like peptidyl-prolyl isomerase
MRLFAITTLLFLGLAATLAAPRAGASEPATAGLAARVNGESISVRDFENELRRLERLGLRGKRPAAVNRKQVLENLIVRELLYQQAKRSGIRVAPEEVAAKFTELNATLSGRAELEQSLDSAGLNRDDLGRQLERGLVLERFLEREIRVDAITEAEVSRHYREHPDQFQTPFELQLSHILINFDRSWSAERHGEAHARIGQLSARLARGEDFATLAREASQCSSAAGGGDLGWYRTGQLSRRLEDQARLLKVGEVSGVVEDRFGLHLLKLTGLRPAALLPLEQVDAKIRTQLKEEKRLKALAPVVKRLRAEAKVELLLNPDEK